jgi:hypothetical protein
LSGKSCWVLVYSALLNLWFSGNPIWPDSIPDGWELEWENDVDEWYSMDGLPCVSSLVLFPLFKLWTPLVLCAEKSGL